MTDTTKHPIALITGGGRGLGKSMALHLADQGVDVVLTYRAGEREAHEVVQQLRDKGRRAAALLLDVGDSKSFAAFATTLGAELSRTFGRKTFDYLVNNGGMAGHASIVETSEEQFDALMNVHLKGPYFLTQRLLPLIEDGGSVLNVSSGLTRFSLVGYAAYASMKGGLEVFTRYLAKELGPRNITVNTIAPGAIETDFGGGRTRDNPEINKMVASVTALGRAGLPDDIGAAVALMLSPASRWITGQRIEVSGGMNL